MHPYILSWQQFVDKFPLVKAYNIFGMQGRYLGLGLKTPKMEHSLFDCQPFMGGAWADKTMTSWELRRMASCDNFGSCWCLEFMLAAVEVLEVIWDDMHKALNDDEFVFTECRWSACISENPSSHQYRFMYHQVNSNHWSVFLRLFCPPTISCMHRHYSEFANSAAAVMYQQWPSAFLFRIHHYRSRLEAIISGSSKLELLARCICKTRGLWLLWFPVRYHTW